MHLAKGKYVSLFASICRGEYDALLSWPFSHRVTFTLLYFKNRRTRTIFYYKSAIEVFYGFKSYTMSFLDICTVTNDNVAHFLSPRAVQQFPATYVRTTTAL